ncbi:MAG: hypothetical protein HYY29_02185 [Chloroflexi bacterium]|nr:hypothetical protein [Chloroflexota bacterium]
MASSIAENLIKEHEAARVTIKLLDDSVTDLDQGLVEIPGDMESPCVLKNQTRTLRWALTYFYDGLKGQLRREEAVVLPRAVNDLRRTISTRHDEIRTELDQAILLADRIAEGEEPRETALRCSRELRERVHRIRELVEEDTGREDAVLRMAE